MNTFFSKLPFFLKKSILYWFVLIFHRYFPNNSLSIRLHHVLEVSINHNKWQWVTGSQEKFIKFVICSKSCSIATIRHLILTHKDYSLTKQYSILQKYRLKSQTPGPCWVLFGSDHELHEEHKNAYLNLLTNFRLGCKICMYWQNTVDHCLWFRNVLSEIKWGIIYIKQIIAMPGGQHCKYDYSFIKTMSHLFSDRHVWTTTECVWLWYISILQPNL